MLDYRHLYLQIGQKIREVRERQELSQEELATILELKRTSVTNIERGRQKLTLETVYRFCDRFGLDIQDVLPGMKALRAAPPQSVTVGGESHAVGSKVANLLSELRPADNTPSTDRDRR